MSYIIKYRDVHGKTKYSGTSDLACIKLWRTHPDVICIHEYDDMDYAGCDCEMPTDDKARLYQLGGYLP